MKKLFRAMIVASFLLFCLTSQALAVGVGMYFEGGHGDGDFDYDLYPGFDVDVDSGAFGFVMDTDLSDRGDFNYRLNVGLERLDIEDKEFNDTLELGGLVVANTFGFAIIKNPDFRWWIGPQIRVGFYGGEWESAPSSDTGLFAFGLGGVTGVNFVTGNACISTSLGLMSTGYAGETEWFGIDEEFDGNYSTVFVNIAVLFGR